MNVKRYILSSQQNIPEMSQFLLDETKNQAPVTHRFTRFYLDTFDWRLLKKQYYLQAETHADEVILQLFSLIDQSLISQFHCDQLPTTQDSLGTGKLSTILRPILKERALTQKIELKVNQKLFNVTAKNNKTTASLSLESERIHNPSQAKHLLIKSLTLSGVKGYSHYKTLDAKLRSKRFNISQAKLSPIEFWIEQSSIKWDQIAPIKLKLKPSTRTDLAAKTILKCFLHDIKINEQGVIDDIDTECLHEFRVAIRRTRSFLSQVPNIFPKRQLNKYKKWFSLLGAKTTPLRDLDVMLLSLNDYQTMLQEAQSGDLEKVKTFILNKRNHVFVDVKNFILSSKYQRLISEWETFLNLEVPNRTRLVNATLPVEQVANQCIWKSYNKLIKKGKQITNESEDSALHDLRKVGKKLRYLIEFFSSLHSKKEIKTVIKTLKLLQDNLGEFQDIHVHQLLLSELREEMSQSNHLDDRTASALESLFHGLELRHHHCREQYYNTFAKFIEPSHQEIFIKLYKS